MEFAYCFSLGVIHKGRPHKAKGRGGFAKSGRGVEGKCGLRKILENCQIEENLLKKCSIIDYNLQITE